MSNAKEEFEEFIKDKPAVKCAKFGLRTAYGYPDDEIDWNVLPIGWEADGIDAFLKDIDFEYNNGYGGQELYGTIWFEDGTYADRGEYDGSEWWEYHKTPEIPEELR